MAKQTDFITNNDDKMIRGSRRNMAGTPVSAKIYCVTHHDPFLGKVERTL
jgi:hypothetical protein